MLDALNLVLAITAFAGWALGTGYLLGDTPRLDSLAAKLSLADLLTLAIVLPVPLAILQSQSPQTLGDSRGYVLIAVLHELLFVYLWWRSVGALNRAGIDHRGRRLFCLAVLLPTSVACTTMFSASVIFPIHTFYTPGAIFVVWLVVATAAWLVVPGYALVFERELQTPGD